MKGTQMVTFEATCPTCGETAEYDERQWLGGGGQVVRSIPLVWRCPTGCSIRYSDQASIVLHRDDEKRPASPA